MTREEAIEYFKVYHKIFCEDYLKICPKDSIAYQAILKEKEFYDMAIKALEQQKAAHWISGHKETGALGITYTEKICSNCGWNHSLVIPKNFCPNCGAKMVEPQESEKISCKTVKCENCTNHNYCDYEPQAESEDKE